MKRATLTVATLLIAAVLPATAVGLTPTGTAKILNARHATSAKEYVTPVAGTTNTSAFGQPWAVYARRNRVGNTPDPSGQLLAVTNAGHATRFGTITADMTSFSLSGFTLTAASSTRASRVYWWRPTSGTSSAGYHVGAVQPGDKYLSSAPNGWVEMDAAGELYDASALAGADLPVPLANPFGSAQGVSGVSGPTGIVVWNASQIAFVSFATGEVTSLDESQLTSLPGGTNTPVCWAVSPSAAACGSYYFTGEDNSGIRNVFLDPLTGGKAFAVSSDQPEPATLQGRSAAWLTDDGKLRILSEQSLIKPSVKIGAAPVAGLGGFLTNDRRRHSGIKLSTNAKRTTTVLPSTHATTEATEFALSAGSVVWLDSASGGATVRRRSVAPNALHLGVRAGSTHTVGASKALRGELAAAGHTYAYPTDLNNSAVGQNGGETLRVVTPNRTVTIHGVDRYLPVSLGDHRVAYYVDDRNARLYDLKTGKTSKYAVSGFALDGHWLAYADQDGTIHLKNLANGSVRTVASGLQLVSDQLFVHGQVVAWNQYPPGNGGHLGYYRDMAGGGEAVQLPTRVNVWQASDAGLVLEQSPSEASSTAPSFPGDRAVRFRAAMTFLLQPYGSATASPLLVADYPMVGPQVAGNIVAWIDQYGDLKARSLH